MTYAVAAALLLTAITAPEAVAATGPPKGWVIFQSSVGRFVVWHPAGWQIRENKGTARTTTITLTDPAGGAAMTIRRRYAPISIGKHCHKVTMRDARVGHRCATKTAVTTTLPDTSEGNFVFRAPLRSFPYGVYTKVVANFQILRGA
ncbi:hypothetical protein J5X84_08680 [Streptosporangiaceae bacterium NEAU-GS5]|nr:hypothetical protein [Streptosporangiaceae bacterium NEAU-GS5]